MREITEIEKKYSSRYNFVRKLDASDDFQFLGICHFYYCNLNGDDVKILF